MQYVIMMVGAAGAGKSTLVKTKLPTATYVSRDSIRFAIMDARYSKDYFAFEDEVFKTFIKTANNAIDRGDKWVVLDATHLNKKSRAKVLNRLHKRDDMCIVAVVVRPSLETHIAHNANRTGRAFVPVDVIEKQYNSYTEPTRMEGFDKVVFYDA